MKIAIQTWGSNGDIRPLLALADGLRRSRHEITLAVSSIDNRSYLTVCRRLGIDYVQVPESIDFDMPAFARRTAHMNTLRWLRALLNEAFFPYEEAIFETARRLAGTHDCLIGHHFLHPLKLAARLEGKPFISVTLCHAAIATAPGPPFRFPDWGAKINRLQWKLLDLMFDMALKKRLSRLWQRAGVPVNGHVYSGLLSSDKLNLVAVDRPLCPPDPSWSRAHRACGFFNMEKHAEPWEMPASLAEFLREGAPPVYMTFGSLQQAVADWSMDLFVEAAQSAGCRAVIQTSSERFPAETRQGDVYFIGPHPHQPVFDRCTAVVHHGGAGTSHAAARSGRPSVVVPFMDEQLFWACRLESLGMAGRPLPARKADAQRLAERICTVLAAPAMAEAARRCREAMCSQSGVAEAVALIEAHVRHAAARE